MRTLRQKLGIKVGHKIHLINPPDNYLQLLGDPLPKNTVHASKNMDFVHFFTNSLEELESGLPILQDQIVSDGMIWVSWYKKASKLPTEINEDVIRNTALALRLVDIKVCSVSSEWSGLKLVIRKNLR